MDAVTEHSREMIRAGSKSFAGAARLLPPDVRDSVYQLYAWCRHCDDTIDLQDLGRGAPGDAAATARERLDALVRDTNRALDGEPTDDPVFTALQRVAARHAIPRRHPLELLRGFEMDVEARRYRTLDDLAEYGYHVAGVVGVMMAHVMGAEGEDTLDRAADLGIALQWTNIARDVMDDATAGRVYLPEDWLEQAGVPPDRIAERRHREAVSLVVRLLLRKADLYYASALAGIARLPLRPAWAIATARAVYRDIGTLVLQRGAAAWDARAYTGKSRKLYRVATGGAQALWLTTFRSSAAPPSRAGLWNRPGRES